MSSRLIVCFLCVLIGFSLVAKEPVEIENVKVRKIEAEKFFRISEFFSGVENTGGRQIFRSHPENRGGLYYIVELSESLEDLPVGLKVHLEYFEVGSSELYELSFPIPSQREDTDLIFIGLTDPERALDFPPIAWRASLRFESGSLLAERKSYMWELPEDG